MDWSIIIGPILNVLLAKCFQQNNANTDPKAYLKSRYNTTTKTFDEQIVRATTQQCRRAALKAKRQASKADRRTFPDYRASDYRDMAIAKLTAAMKAPDTAIQQVFAVANAFDDLDGE